MLGGMDMAFILNGILWTLALYGLFEIIKTIIYICTYTNQKSDGIYLILAVKNQEEKLEGFLRIFLFRLLYGKEEQVRQIMIADLDSSDKTFEVASKFCVDYENIKVGKWRDCKEIFDAIDE